MYSEHPMHCMYEQWYALGVYGILSAFNFPVAILSWNIFTVVIYDNMTVWKPSPKTPLIGIVVQHLCNRLLEHHGYQVCF